MAHHYRIRILFQSSVAFVGLGYIGLPTAVVMANAGVNVTGIDLNAANVERINCGELTFAEPKLQKELTQALESGRFKARTTQIHADVYIIAVPTPFDDTHNVDMTYIYKAAENIAPFLQGDELIILESTSPPGTTRKLADHIVSLRPDLTADSNPDFVDKPIIYFAHCPERILPGNAIAELRTNDRIIGGQSETATRRAAEVYATFCSGNLLPTSATTAEMAKLTENSFRDLNIAFANELSIICDNLKIDVWELIELANHHPRVNILQPGPGVGGHCIAVDPWFLVAADPENANLVRTARDTNDKKPEWVAAKIIRASQELAHPRIAILGLAFKANVDDLRQSPAIEITKRVADELDNASIRIVEPNIQNLPPELGLMPNVSFLPIDSALKDADVVALLVDHEAFKALDPVDLQDKILIDTKGFWRTSSAQSWVEKSVSETDEQQIDG